MHEVLVNRLGSLSLPRQSVVRLTDRPDMTLDVYRGRKTTMQHQQKKKYLFLLLLSIDGLGNMHVDQLTYCFKPLQKQRAMVWLKLTSLSTPTFQ